ncbi:fluoride efflux transporter CrcB [Fervidobacterium thailandense]|uniref:Fluoride-specific ion channel FluC n=1 Tax=Fervidobacterium thailandense TaxID=1008305 RepID=A0A1E3G2F6_9BACT|nr:fluoride efflux transporter CrcB [Fervidobacterium thailandense]ODN30429.1 camphor resistance protein CrcB [Fervidobacterium thailandense]
MNLLSLIYVGAGGCVGSVLRYIISLWFNEKFPNSFVPYGTLLVNVVGSFLLGVILEFSLHGDLSYNVRLFLTTGIMGGLTTFSTFSYETVALINSALYSQAIANVALNLGLGLGGALAGISLVRLIFKF